MKGMLQIYTGNGKGKTTASLGLALRAAGHGNIVCMIQFMKGQTNYGELESAKKIPGFEIRQFGRPDFVDKKNPDPRDIQGAREALAYAAQIIKRGGCDVLILDELNVACDFGLVDKQSVLELVDSKPEAMELVITGRYAPQWLLEKADLITEMKEIKHYYQQEVPAREGIEF